eukprot:9404203-Alexandrium_andersonii.AAC.1
MSASLVGSEMCIRDSSPTAGRRRLEVRRSRFGSAPIPPTVVPVGEALQSVSYTHLTLPTICSV